MLDNTTKLLSLIVKGMSEEDIELNHVDLYEEAVGINNKVKVCIGVTGNGKVWFLVHRLDTVTCSSFQLYSAGDMLSKVLELLTEEDWLPGDDIEAYGEWFTLVIEEDDYYTVSNNEHCSYRLLDENYSLSNRMTLNDLKKNYTNASLEKRLNNRFYRSDG